MKIIRNILIMALSAMLSAGFLAVSASAAEATVEGIGFVSATSLHLRSQPSTDSAILSTAPQNDCVVILSQEDGWYRVNYNLQEGYMAEEYLSFLAAENAELGKGQISGSGVNLRGKPSTGSQVLTVTTAGGECDIIGVNNGWYKVLYNGYTGYIRSDYVHLTEIPYENQASPNSPKYFRHGSAIGSLPSGNTNPLTGDSSIFAEAAGSTTVSGSDILAEAQQYLGTPYVNGGASPSGFDCSGFVYYVLGQCGISAYRTPADQYQQGTAVERDDLQPGDIVFFAGTYASGISHVGIYAGGGQFIHSPNSRSTVSYSDLTSGYWAEHYYGARRMG